jgi:hypothetical protein
VDRGRGRQNSLNNGRKKTRLKAGFFESGRRERITRICDACPAGQRRGVVQNCSRQFCLHPLIKSGRKKTRLKAGFFENGRRERIRTSDPLVPNQLRYQAALLADAGRILLLAYQSVNHFFIPLRQVVIKAPY